MTQTDENTFGQQSGWLNGTNFINTAIWCVISLNSVAFDAYLLDKIQGEGTEPFLPQGPKRQHHVEPQLHPVPHVLWLLRRGRTHRLVCG